jgi:hypothetical protein
MADQQALCPGAACGIGQQLVAGFLVVGVSLGSLDGAHIVGLLRLVEPDALGALGGIDHIDVIALRDGLVRALGSQDPQAMHSSVILKALPRTS